jgi:hypothetical protein
MAEFTYNPIQLVQPNQPVILNDSIRCPKGYVVHRNESGIVTLRGIVNNACGCFARYQVTFNGNIAVPTGGTAPAGISVALAIDGEPILTSKAIVTPAATAVDDPPTDENYFNVTSTAIVTVPKGCCFNVSVENTSAPADATTPAPAINVKNANLTVSRIA